MWDCHPRPRECFGNSRCPSAHVCRPLNHTGCLHGGNAPCLSIPDNVALERQSVGMCLCYCHLLNYPICFLKTRSHFEQCLQHWEAALGAFTFVGFPLGGVYTTRLHRDMPGTRSCRSQVLGCGHSKGIS